MRNRDALSTNNGADCIQPPKKERTNTELNAHKIVGGPVSKRVTVENFSRKFTTTVMGIGFNPAQRAPILDRSVTTAKLEPEVQTCLSALLLAND